MIDPQYTTPEHLGDPYLGAWYEPQAFGPDIADRIMQEVEGSGQVEPIWDLPDSSVSQIFRRLLIDMQKDHDFPQVAALGEHLVALALDRAGHLFPKLHSFQIDEAAVQIYPAGTQMALGWHKDHKLDELLVISATIDGDGVVSFTEKSPYKDTTEEDIIANVPTSRLGALFFRANGLYEREDGSDIRLPHAVTSIGDNTDRFTIQYRMGVNAGAYGNTHVNAANPLRLPK